MEETDASELPTWIGQTGRGYTAMSIRHPKPKQIRLPFNVPRPGASSAQARLCGMYVADPPHSSVSDD